MRCGVRAFYLEGVLASSPPVLSAAGTAGAKSVKERPAQSAKRWSSEDAGGASGSHVVGALNIRKKVWTLPGALESQRRALSRGSMSSDSCFTKSD